MTTVAHDGRPVSAQDSRASARASERGDAELLRRYASTRDPRLHEQLVERFLPLARHAAARYMRSGEPFEDLVQIACEGLLKALSRFDPERSSSFAAYALPTMRGELRRYFRDRGWMVRPPRDLQERTLRVERTIEDLSGRLGRPPTVPEVAAALEIEDEDVLEALEAGGGRRAISFSAPWGRGDGEDDVLEDGLGDADDGFERADTRMLLDALAQVLDTRERRVLHLRFHHDLTQAEIGQTLGISQMQVSRVLRAALAKLRLAAEHHERLGRRIAA
jgi:RNA polymerase sigma-B factor